MINMEDLEEITYIKLDEKEEEIRLLQETDFLKAQSLLFVLRLCGLK